MVLPSTVDSFPAVSGVETLGRPEGVTGDFILVAG